MQYSINNNRNNYRFMLHGMRSAAVLTLLSSAFLLSALSLAHAQNTTFTFPSTISGNPADPNYDNIVNISENGGASYFSVYAGRYVATLNGTSTNVYCVDYTHEINLGQSYQADVVQNITDNGTTTVTGGYYNGGLSSALTSSNYNPANLGTVSAAPRSSEVAYLADNYLNATAAAFASNPFSTNLNTNETAIQLAIWDIIQDGGNGLGVGEVQTDSAGQSAYGSLVGYYESLAGQNQSYVSNSAFWIQGPVGSDGSHSQNFVGVGGFGHPTINTAPAVPEPGAPIVLLSAFATLAVFCGARRALSRA